MEKDAKLDAFKTALRYEIYIYQMDKMFSSTPDQLAEYLIRCLETYRDNLTSCPGQEQKTEDVKRD